MESFFKVLEKEFVALKELGEKIEQNIYLNPTVAIMESRFFAEKLIEEVLIKESLNDVISLSQFERVKILNREGIIEDLIVRDFDDIRIIGNKVVHQGKNNDVEFSVRLHKKLYKITKWFFETYSSDYSKQMPAYNVPEVPKNNDVNLTSKIDEIFEKKLTEFFELTQKKLIVGEIGIERDSTLSQDEQEVESAEMEILGFQYKDEILVEDIKEVKETSIVNKDIDSTTTKEITYTYKKLKGSYLLNEISKLSSSSQEAVESSSSLDSFKSYLHVERSIQSEFLSLLDKASVTNKAELILLCGSVGDGKSHLLAYVNENYKDILSKFKIHNDATESFDPQLTEIDTLANILSEFNDDKLESSQEKLILAINLGVLNNFLEADFAKNNFKKLINFIEDSRVFSQDTVTNGYSSENFKLVSFGNYNIYELTKDGPKSKYIEELLNKVIEKDLNNPFYSAYLKDIEEDNINPTLINYEFLSLNGVKERIADLLILAIVKHKKLISTRELFNFIYEILVPANIEEFDITSSSIDYLETLLPNLIFNSIERGSLINAISKEDVINIRHEQIDNLLINLNINNHLLEVLREYVDINSNSLIDKLFRDIEDINYLTESVKNSVVNTIIRLLYFIGNDKIRNIFDDLTFKEYMTYLYYFNCGQHANYKRMFEEVKQAVYNWNNNYKDNYIYLNEKLQHFKVAEKLDLKPSKKGSCSQQNNEVIERFKTNVNIALEVKDKNYTEVLEVDYQLYKKIVEINNGYYASKNDREEAIIFVEFIEKLIKQGNMETELLVLDKRDKKVFKLTYEDDFDEEFIFERME